MSNQEGAGVQLADLGAQDAKFSTRMVKRSRYASQTLEEAFPKADPEQIPLGERVLVQIRTAPKKTAGGLVLTHGDQDTEKWNTQVAKVIAVGPTAFKNRDTLEPWPEGAWFKVGDFVRVPKYGGDRFEVYPEGEESDEKVVFAIFRDNDFLTVITGDPLKVAAYI